MHSRRTTVKYFGMQRVFASSSGIWNPWDVALMFSCPNWLNMPIAAVAVFFVCFILMFISPTMCQLQNRPCLLHHNSMAMITYGPPSVVVAVRVMILCLACFLSFCFYHLRLLSLCSITVVPLSLFPLEIALVSSWFYWSDSPPANSQGEDCLNIHSHNDNLDGDRNLISGRSSPIYWLNFTFIQTILDYFDFWSEYGRWFFFLLHLTVTALVLYIIIALSFIFAGSIFSMIISLMFPCFRIGVIQNVLLRSVLLSLSLWLQLSFFLSWLLECLSCVFCCPCNSRSCCPRLSWVINYELDS